MCVGGALTPDLIVRLQNSTENTLALAAKVHLEMELIIVEWNLPPGDPGIEARNILPRAQQLEQQIRVLSVSREYHARVPNPHGFGFFEWWPKNIGIRRAEGRFVLVTNPDDLFTLNMFAHFKSGFLKEGNFYRATRHDTRDGKVYQILHPTGVKPAGAMQHEIRQPLPGAAPWSENMIHYNASGDFILMAKSDWELIHGAPEREYNHSIDGQTLWLAHTKVLKQIVLPFPIFHSDHARSLDFSTEKKTIWHADWDDKRPFTKENGEEWGHAGVEFPEVRL
jgi:hypothetical protein